MKATSLNRSISKTRPALRLVSTKELPREDWLQIRKQGIGSSDAAAAVGLNPYKSQLELWMEKTGRDAGMPKADPQDEESPMYWGNVLEPIVAWHYSKRTKNKVRRINAVLQHPDAELPWMLANIDSEVIGADDVQILECKTAGINGARLWKEGVPEYVQLQVMHQLAVTGKQAADVAVLLGGQTLEIHRIERDEQMIARLIELERKFWHYVETDTPPPADGTASAESALRCLYPEDNGQVVDFSLAITPPILGRISIGKVIEKNGKRLPEKDDQFTITSQVQGKDGWLLHPLNDELRQGKDDKLRSIPVRLLFNEPDLNFRADYTLFDRQSGRPVCVGNGETCKRVTQDGMQSLPCPSPDVCPIAKGGACKPYGRLNVVIGDEDPLGSFVFRTTGFNSIRTLAARLHYFQAISGDRLACLPLELRLRGKSTRQSHGTPIFYADLTVRSGMDMAEALVSASELDSRRQAAGFNQAALDEAARRGFGNGAFEDSEEDASAIVEEFFPEGEAPAAAPTASLHSTKPSLAEKLDAQAARQTPPTIQGGHHALAQAESQ